MTVFTICGLIKNINSQPQLLRGDICNLHLLSKTQRAQTYIRVRLCRSDVLLFITSLLMDAPLLLTYIHFIEAPSAVSVTNNFWCQDFKVHISNLANYILVQLWMRGWKYKIRTTLFLWTRIPRPLRAPNTICSPEFGDRESIFLTTVSKAWSEIWLNSCTLIGIPFLDAVVSMFASKYKGILQFFSM